MRIPFEPLLLLTDKISGPGGLAERCGVTPRTIQRWKVTGVPLVQADRAAVTAGHHPCHLWSDWYSYGTVVPNKEE